MFGGRSNNPPNISHNHVEIIEQSMFVQVRDLELTHADVFRVQDVDSVLVRERRPSLYTLTEQALEESKTLLQPELVYRRLAVQRVEHNRMRLDGGYSLKSKILVERLAQAEYIYTVIGTVGKRISERASLAMSENQFAYGYALDCCGTAALQKLAHRFTSWIESTSVPEGLKVSRRFSPGSHFWPVSQGQPEIFMILDDRNKIVRLTPSNQMIPIKSISFILGVGKNLKITESECSDCSLRNRCTYRNRFEKVCAHE